jgi:S1-C subfamily serine protease
MRPAFAAVPPARGSADDFKEAPMSVPDLATLSHATAAAVAAAAERVARLDDGARHLSGLIWSEGLIVTAEECLAGDDVTATLPDGRAVAAELAGRDPSTDVALLRADTGPPPDWPEAATPAAGALALAVGRGGSPLAAFGIVAEAGPAWTSSAGGRIDARIRLSFALPHRIEGGAAVDAEGRLLGLAVADPRRRALVIPTSTVARAVAALAAHGYVGRGYLGLALQPLRGAGGLIVVEVSEGGPAAAAGFLVGDVVTTWDGGPVGSMRALARRLGPETIGQQVKLGVTRAGSPLEVAVTIGERRPGRAE